ncbi:glycosyltransferase 87 family protein [Actinomadura rugatobispora]|uniref:Glycosyltransferase 87 family protein n=1 Tax=Actinomadura rugatobispora TaxID=1994 RepID=A0ABW1A3L3_9ACTN|nr:glycosyltransferase 87 family protein [Actinomadura rugatobispora]
MTPTHALRHLPAPVRGRGRGSFAVQPALYAGFAVFAAVTAAVTGLAPHRAWGGLAAVAYGLGALAALAPWGRRHRARVAAGVLASAVLVPLAVLVATGQAQPEVGVVQRSGAHLLEHGTPYLGAVELAAHGGYEAYNPYLPGMALLGLPWAVAGIDARLLFGGLFLLLLLAAGGLLLRGHGGIGARSLPLLVLAGSPLVSLPLVVGGDDLPVIGLVCLGLALAVRDRHGAAGLALGLAASLKATGWPALLVCLALVAASAQGRAAIRRYGTAASGVLAAGVLLPALVDPEGFVLNVVRFPLGLAGTASPADSPLPGRLLADLGPHGHATALTLLGLAALTMGASLLVRPPAGARQAALRLALGLLLATALMPATRWGYLVYPAVLALWARFGVPPAPRKPAPRKEDEELCLVA